MAVSKLRESFHSARLQTCHTGGGDILLPGGRGELTMDKVAALSPFKQEQTYFDLRDCPEFE